MASPNTTGSEENAQGIDPEHVVLEMDEEMINTLTLIFRNACKQLGLLADEIDQVFKYCNRGKIFSSACALLGFALSIPTFGASAVPAYIAAVGCITTAGLTYYEHYFTKQKCRAAQEAVNAVSAEVRAEDMERIRRMVPSTDFYYDATETGSFLTGMASGTVSPVLRQVQQIRVEEAKNVAPNSEEDRAHRIKFFVINAVLLPVDIRNLIWSSLVEFTKTGSPKANKIRELANEIHLLAYGHEENAGQNSADP